MVWFAFWLQWFLLWYFGPFWFGFGSSRFSLVRFGSVWSIGSFWFLLVHFVSFWSILVNFGQFLFSQFNFNPFLTGSGRHIRTECHRSSLLFHDSERAAAVSEILAARVATDDGVREDGPGNDHHSGGS